MAISASTQWNVRTDGSDTNGGGFVSGASGTDYSRQAAKNTVGSNISTTDAVANGTTTITSATAAFTSAIVGNLVYFTGGSGSITAVWRQVTAFTNSTTITIDTSISASTGMTMNIGGALLTISKAASVAVAFNSIHVKSGTYTVTSAISLTNGPNRVIGYQTTPLDAGTKPLITCATNSVALFAVNSDHQYTLSNLSLSHTATTRGAGITVPGPGGSYSPHIIENCVIDGTSNAFLADNGTATASGVQVVGCEIKNCTSDAVVAWFGMRAVGCWIHDNAGAAFKKMSSQGSLMVFVGNIITGNTKGIVASGFNPVGGGGTTEFVFLVSGNTFAANTGDAIAMTSFAVGGTGSAPMIENNIFDGNSGYGINSGALDINAKLLTKNNSWRANSSGNVNNWDTGVGAVFPSVSPFTSSTDFSLNSNASGGTLLKSAGYPGAFAGGTSTGYPDIGAVQSQASSGSSAAANYGFIG